VPRRNRVTPEAELIAVPDRGMFLGNRGALHDRGGNLVRYSRGRLWLICLTEFKARRRPLWAPGKLTELFFLDEATALAAGHRPCGECRSAAYRAFKAAWGSAHPGQTVNAATIDTRLHADRLADKDTKRTFSERLGALPNATMIRLDGRPWLVHGDQLLAWAPGGYEQRRRRANLAKVTVLTPRATVATLAAGYQPELHRTAQR
jgi:hypothetical protein